LIATILSVLGSVFTWLNKKQDVDLEKYKVDGVVDVEALKADVAIIQAQGRLQEVLKDDPVLRWGRRLIIYPTGGWYILIVWYCITKNNSVLKDYSWVILDLPTHLQYIPYAVTGFLLLHTWMKK
jgi:hypothetical protein